jgi:hypothetical protein
MEIILIFFRVYHPVSLVTVKLLIILQKLKVGKKVNIAHGLRCMLQESIKK